MIKLLLLLAKKFRMFEKMHESGTFAKIIVYYVFFFFFFFRFSILVSNSRFQLLTSFMFDLLIFYKYNIH